MELATRIKYLKIALIISGLTFIFFILPAMHVWPTGWRWIPPQPKYEQMIIGIYVTLGLFLLRAAKNPLENLSLIWFTVWSNFVHGGIMMVQSIVYEGEHGHLLGDVPGLIIIGLVLAWLTPRKKPLA